MGEAQPGWERSIPCGQSWGGCRACKHLQPGAQCAAFPDLIPLVIFSGEVDHLAVRPGQVGDTVFEIAEQPSGLALRRIRNAAAHGEAWAAKALTKANAAVSQRSH